MPKRGSPINFYLVPEDAHTIKSMAEALGMHQNKLVVESVKRYGAWKYNQMKKAGVL